jgi:signal transduction histidine kinase
LYVIHDVSAMVEANWWREQILYTLAHEIAGSFTLLQHGLELIEQEEPDCENAGFLRIAQQTIEKTHLLMEDLLAAGSLRGRRFKVHPRRVRLDELVREAASAVWPETQSRSQRIQLALPKADVWVAADARYVSRVLFNLLRNASKYSPDGAQIRVTARVAKDGWARITVGDQGTGIAPKELPSIFDPFYRARPTSSQAGVGLGLAIAQAIVQAHGGRVGIRSRLGHGTTVWFTLAVAPPPAPLVA